MLPQNPKPKQNGKDRFGKGRLSPRFGVRADAGRGGAVCVSGGHCDLVCPSVGTSPRGRLQLEVLRPGHRPETELHAVTNSGCCAWLLTQRVARQAVT